MNPGKTLKVLEFETQNCQAQNVPEVSLDPEKPPDKSSKWDAVAWDFTTKSFLA